MTIVQGHWSVCACSLTAGMKAQNKPIYYKAACLFVLQGVTELYFIKFEIFGTLIPLLR